MVQAMAQASVKAEKKKIGVVGNKGLFFYKK
jgi:hypothetical protein